MMYPLTAPAGIATARAAGAAGFRLWRMDSPFAPAVDAPDDRALMLAYAAGDQTAFATLYARHRVALYRFLLRQLRNESLAEELFQDVWQKIIRTRHSWKPDAPFHAWLYRIAHNRLNDYWRAQKHRPPAPDDAEARILGLRDEHSPEQMLSAFQQRRRLQQALEALPDEQRTVLLLRLEQEMSLEDIGHVTGSGRETVKSRLRYAMDKLRARLQP